MRKVFLSTACFLFATQNVRAMKFDDLSLPLVTYAVEYLTFQERLVLGSVSKEMAQAAACSVAPEYVQCLRKGERVPKEIKDIVYLLKDSDANKKHAVDKNTFLMFNLL